MRIQSIHEADPCLHKLESLDDDQENPNVEGLFVMEAFTLG